MTSGHPLAAICIVVSFLTLNASHAGEIASRADLPAGLHAAWMETIHVVHDLESNVSVDVSLAGAPRRLKLRPHSLRSADFKVMVSDTAGRLIEAPTPPVTTYRGEVEGLPDSRVTASIIDGRLTAEVVLTDAERWWVQPHPDAVRAAAGDHVVYRSNDLSASPELQCGVIDPKDKHAASAVGRDVAPQGKFDPAPTLEPRVGSYFECQIAFDADTEFYVLNGSNITATVADIENVMNFVDTIYNYELGISYSITFVHVWNGEPDPYNTGNNGCSLLDAFGNKWNDDFEWVPRDVAHLMTGLTNLVCNCCPNMSSIDGRASTGTVCDWDGDAYAFSRSRSSEWMPIRASLTSHELGHNWNATHCDNGDGPCVGVPDCPNSIMYSISNSSHTFTGCNRNEIINFRNSRNCLTYPVSPSDDAFEPNNSRDDAAPITTGSRWLMQLDAEDYYGITLCQTATLSVSLEYSIHMDLELKILTTGGCVKASSNSPSGAEYTWVTLPPGTYVINIRRWDAGPGGPYRMDILLSNGNGDPACDGGIRYVRPTGSCANGGASWANAYNNLQDALTAKRIARGAIREIWIAGGLYSPGADRASTYLLTNDLILYGGFSATGNPTFAQRNPTVYPVLLSGNIGNPNDPTDNCYHVVTANGVNTTAVLDGLTFLEGYANGTGVDDRGAGMYCVNASPVLRNCVFRNNYATAYGGGLYATSSTLDLTKCLLRDNAAGGFGGAVFTEGGGTSSRFTHCTFLKNTTNSQGGALFIFENSSAQLFGCLFSRNETPNHNGNAIYSHNASTECTNCTIASGRENTALFANANGSINLRNSIVWGNSHGGVGGAAAQYGVSPDATITFDHCNVEGIVPPGVGNLSADPIFIDPDGVDNILGTMDDNYRLAAGSPCNDAGRNDSLAATFLYDYDGYLRRLNDVLAPDTGTGSTPLIDLGPYEYGQASLGSRLYVDADASGYESGATWADAIRDLQYAASLARTAAPTVTEIWVAQGLYKPTGGLDPEESFLLQSGVALYGSFAGSETSPSQRNIALNPTLLSGDIGAVGLDTDNSYHVVQAHDVSADTILDGFTILNGNADDAAPHDRGGGLYVTDSSPIIRNCTLRQNKATAYGGGIYAASSPLSLRQCVFLDNEAGGFGGAVFTEYGNAFSLYDYCSFYNNRTGSQGGAMFVFDTTTAQITNCLFSGNETPNHSGNALYVQGATALIRHSTIVNGKDHTAVYANTAGNIFLVDSILWGNSHLGGISLATQYGAGGGGSVSVNYCNLEGGLAPGTGNISADPLFANAAGADADPGTLDDDLHLTAGSPCIDAGNPNYSVIIGWDVDVDGQPRLQGCYVDMGIDELAFGFPHSGDLTADGDVTESDIAPFVSVLLTGGTQWQVCVADINLDDAANGGDIQGFIANLIGP